MVRMMCTAGTPLCTLTLGVLLCLVLPVRGECETTIENAMSHCFAQYYAHTMDVDYYKGLDAETLRSICRTTQLAIRCTHRKCPDTSQDAVIQVLSTDVLNVMDICVYKNILEIYSRNQFCFLQTAPSSERCFNNYQATTLSSQQQAKNGNPSAIQDLCSEYKKMVQCIKASVSQCTTTEASDLVDVLVRPSVLYSEHCPREGVSTTTTQPLPKVQPTKQIIGDDEELLQAHAQNVAVRTGHISLSSLLLTLLVFIYLTKPL